MASSTGEASSRPKAGRNLPAAFASGAIFGGSILVALLAVPRIAPTPIVTMVVWACVIGVLVALALAEVTAQLQKKEYALSRILLQCAGQLIVWAGVLGPRWVLGAFLVSSMVVCVARLGAAGRTGSPQGWLRDSSLSIFVLSWIPLMAACAVMLMGYAPHSAVSPMMGPYVLLSFILVVVCSDTGGYLFGVLWGKHPLVPAISPKKSWEGLAGSLVFAVPVAILLSVYLLHIPLWSGLLLGIALVASDLLGDLVESQFKRELGIKDMSNLIPGHGGMMDRVDGMLPSAALTWCLLTVMALFF